MEPTVFLILIISIIAFCGFLISDNSKTNREKEKDLDYRVYHNVTTPEEREYGDEPNTDLTEEEYNRLDIHPVRLRQFILDYTAAISRNCMTYLNLNSFWDDKDGQREKQTYTKNALRAISAETAVALFSLCHELFRHDMTVPEWDTLYHFFHTLWDTAFNEGRYSFSGFNRIDYDDLIKTRMRVYREIIRSNQNVTLTSLLESYIDYHAQTLISILPESCVTLYEPATSEKKSQASNTGPSNILYQTIDFSMMRIRNSPIEPRIKTVLRKGYSRFLNIDYA